MARRNMKSALGTSLDAETRAFQTRLAKADQVLQNGAPSNTSASPSISPSMGERADNGTEIVSSHPPETVVRVVREAFTLPESEQGQIEDIRERMLKQAIHVTKSEVMRAGLLALSELDDQKLAALIERIEKVRTGRPKSL